MSPQASKSGIKFYCSNKMSQNFQQEGFIFKSMKGILDISVICFLVFLSSVLIKIMILCTFTCTTKFIIILMCVTFETIAVDRL